MIQIKLMPLPTPNRAWAAHFQFGKFGKKGDGDYKSGTCVLSQDDARVIIQGQRSISYRFSSSESYFQEDIPASHSPEDIRFGQTLLRFNRAQVMDLLDNKEPIHPELDAATKVEFEQVEALWEKNQNDFAAKQEGKAPETLMH